MSSEFLCSDILVLLWRDMVVPNTDMVVPSVDMVVPLWRHDGSSVETWWFLCGDMVVPLWRHGGSQCGHGGSQCGHGGSPGQTWWFLVVVQVRTAPKRITDRITCTPFSLTIHYEIHKKTGCSAQPHHSPSPWYSAADSS